jgi:hypothetical protein
MDIGAGSGYFSIKLAKAGAAQSFSSFGKIGGFIPFRFQNLKGLSTRHRRPARFLKPGRSLEFGCFKNNIFEK